MMKVQINIIRRIGQFRRIDENKLVDLKNEGYLTHWKYVFLLIKLLVGI